VLILSTSVTCRGGELLTTPKDIDNEYGKQIDVIIDGGLALYDYSSVISLINDQPEIIREGKGDISEFE